ncbi:MAG: hypothetical protein WC917_02975 [Bacilli bacterium]|jgi:hypothetical protein
MEIKRTCKICGKEFTAIKTNQFFCCRKCFKKDFYARTRIKLQSLCNNPKYPDKTCPLCGKKSSLNFDPIKKPDFYSSWTCPYCGVPNNIVLKYQNEENSRSIIKNILITIGCPDQMKTVQHTQIYNIPIISPEQGDTDIITLACESINIIEVQKMNRKKITFS